MEFALQITNNKCIETEYLYLIKITNNYDSYTLCRQRPKVSFIEKSHLTKMQMSKISKIKIISFMF